MTTHTTHQHKRYWMTCEDYDHLLQRAGSCCELCGASRRLVIDHDDRRGTWAVRGLLCIPCNTRITDGRSPFLGAAARAYLARPWVDERFGAAVAIRPEPPIASVVGVPDHRGWIRLVDAWHGRGHYRGRGTASWGELNNWYPPHRLRIVLPLLAAGFEVLAGSP